MIKKFIPFAMIAVLALSAPLVQSGCSSAGKSNVTLAPGGAYTDPVLASTDRSILDASEALAGFVEWHSANAAFLSKTPAVAELAARVSAQKDGWIRAAYAARDSYAAASKAFMDGQGDLADVDRKRAALNGALAVINNISLQIVAARNAKTNG